MGKIGGSGVSFDRARAVADAVLFEGYPKAAKNLLRWQLGVLAPRAATGRDGCWMEAQFLVAAGAQPRITGKLRFLRICRRRVETLSGERLSSLEVGGRLLVSWDEGEICEVDLTGDEQAIELEGGETLETVGEIARVRRTRQPLSLRVRVDADGIFWRIHVENLSVCEPCARREEMLPSATLGTHLILAVENGEFVSLLDPPPELAAEAAACHNVGTHPVLAGQAGRKDLLLSSPSILLDHPTVENPSELVDDEIDVLLDRVEVLPAEAQGPTDAQELLLDGRTATLCEVKWDLDGDQCLAVTIDGHPIAELHDWLGRRRSDEVQEIGSIP
jgi:hypothetical protein